MANRAAAKRAAKARPPAAKKGTATRPRAARRGAGYVVFISHSSKESWIARQIAKEVKAAGGTSWVDVNVLAGGDDFQDEILEAIRTCSEAIVLISPDSVNSQWVSYEIGAVAVQGKRVTPVLNNVPPEAMAPLRRVHAIDLNNFDAFLGQLKERIRQSGGRRR